jgi:hypothetical protein
VLTWGKASATAGGLDQTEARIRGERLASAIPVLFVAIAVVAIASSQGGYFPTSWGWSVLAFVGVLSTWALATGVTDAGRKEATFLITLAALTAWVALSITWSSDPAESVLELERWLVLLAGCSCLVVLARRTSFHALTVGLVLAIAAVDAYALSTRLIPDRFGTYDPTAGYRLSAPIGYWNALGIFTVVGILLALGLATERRAHLAVRSGAAAVLVFMPLVIYFTFGRASWVALALGLAALIGLGRDRLRVSTEAVWLALLALPAVLVASRSSSLTSKSAALAAAAHAGHRLLMLVAGISLLAALSVGVVVALERRISFTARRRRAYAIVFVAAPVCAAVAAIVALGGPVHLAERGYDSFVAAAPSTEANDLNHRLFSFNGNGRVTLWQVALDADRGHWLGGTGAGSYERTWDQSPRANEIVRDAHSLYVETLSELGIVGLALIAILLCLPLVIAYRVRAAPGVAAAAGAYLAFVLHNGVDWDWELSGVTLTGLFLGAMLLLPARPARDVRLGPPARAVVGVGSLAVAAFAAVAVIGNDALAQASAANGQGLPRCGRTRPAGKALDAVVAATPARPGGGAARPPRRRRCDHELPEGDHHRRPQLARVARPRGKHPGGDATACDRPSARVVPAQPGDRRVRRGASRTLTRVSK